MVRALNPHFMRRLFACAALLGSVMLVPSEADASSFVFSGQDNKGVGSAFMDMNFDFSTNTLTVTIENTSPTTLTSGTGKNAPGITGFGFDLLGPIPQVLSWKLEAYDKGGDLVTIGGSPVDGEGDWKLGTRFAGVKFDYLPNSHNVKGAIYNPEATHGLAARPNYFSRATLTITFSAAALLDLERSPFVRMQNVGKHGDGSLKLYGSLLDTTVAAQPQSAAAPEPASMVLFGVGMACCSGYAIRRRKFKSAA